MRFSETRNYGFNEIIKQYARFPWYRPLPCHFEHGWTPSDYAPKSDLTTDKPLMLTISGRRAKSWKRKSQIPVEIVGAPFIHFKNMRKIVRQINAKGTVAFPGHSTYDDKSQYSTEQYCRDLKNLAEEFQPITICLFWLDYIEKEADIYRKHGFKVMTAGYKFSIGLNFAKNFYKILSSHKYATSNDVGSYMFYAVDLGLPFFLSGQAPAPNYVEEYINTDNSDLANDFTHGKIATRIFSTGPVTEISPQQKKYVDQEMGLNDCLSQAQLHNLLNQYNKSYRSLRKTILYLTESIFLRFVLNGPWGQIVVLMRKKITRHRDLKSAA